MAKFIAMVQVPHVAKMLIEADTRQQAMDLINQNSIEHGFIREVSDALKRRLDWKPTPKKLLLSQRCLPADADLDQDIPDVTSLLRAREASETA